MYIHIYIYMYIHKCMYIYIYTRSVWCPNCLTHSMSSLLNSDEATWWPHPMVNSGTAPGKDPRQRLNTENP